MLETYFPTIVLIWIGLGLLILPLLLIVRAPYGRYTDRKWGAQFSNRFSWFIMELPAFLVFPCLFLFGPGEKSTVTWVFFGLWVFHYLNRDLVFPWRLKTKHKKMPLAIMFFGMFFNGMNGFVNGYYLGFMSPTYELSWLLDWRFILGLMVFIGGMYINWHADAILISLRKPGETHYTIPTGWLYNYISCPNYLGEIIEWSGFALMAWNLPALSFVLWTAVNLLPRGLSHHKWYQQHFPDYPKNRKAILPFIL